MSQERSVFVAFLLSLGILILWRAFIVKTPPPAPKPATTASLNSSAAPLSPVAPAGAITARKGRRSTPAAALPVEKAATAKQVVIEGADYRVTVSNRGAVVTSWVLQRYKNEQDAPLDLIDQNACSTLGFPLGLRLEDSSLAEKLNNALYVAQVPSDTLSVPSKVVFVYSDGAIQAKKEISFGLNYQVHVDVSVSDGARQLPVQVVWTGGFGDPSLPPKIRDASTQGVYGSLDDFTTIGQKKIKRSDPSVNRSL